MKKVLIILGIVFGVAAVAVGTFFITSHFHQKETDQLTSQVATLNANIAAIGEITTCYTVQSPTFPGQEITEDLVVEQSIPSSFKNDSFAGREDLIGLYSKVAITPGTPITKDMVMDELIEDSTREMDITANRWPIGLQVGDYVDVRITYPRGEDFIVLSHKRVMSITEQTLKVYMTEEEQILYQSALVDFYLSRGYGSDMYMTKYVEPGVQEAAHSFYSVPANIAAVVLKDPNVVNRAQVVVEESLRNAIEAARQDFVEGDPSGAEIKNGRDELNGKTNSDFVTYEVEKEKAEKEAEQGDDAQSSLITDITAGVY